VFACNVDGTQLAMWDMDISVAGLLYVFFVLDLEQFVFMSFNSFIVLFFGGLWVG
jgi:hypothetical protein